MFRNRRIHLVLPVMALGLMLGTAMPARSATDVSLQINFGRTPRWETVRGTEVRVIRMGDRSDYDVFRYGSRYYAYNYVNDNWYVSRRYSGRFRLIDDRSVPREIRRIPRQHWRHYPASWEGGYRRGGGYRSGSYFTVSFGSPPRWSWVRGTRVQVIPYAERPNYDVFRYSGTYYVYNNGVWYSSTRETGQFYRIEDRDVPDELYRVPRDQWRSYPRDRDYRSSSSGSSATFEVSFGSPPRWTWVDGARVQVIPYSQRPDYDVFRVDGIYYVYANGEWYSSPRESGEFTRIDVRDVPDELYNVPRDQWRSYPPAWGRRRS